MATPQSILVRVPEPKTGQVRQGRAWLAGTHTLALTPPSDTSVRQPGLAKWAAGGLGLSGRYLRAWCAGIQSCDSGAGWAHGAGFQGLPGGSALCCTVGCNAPAPAQRAVLQGRAAL